MDRRFLRVVLAFAIILVAGLCSAAALGAPPNPTGTWHAQHDPTPWHLTASSDLSRLTAIWRGNPKTGHGHLRGTFSGQLDPGGDSYSGTMHITEDATDVHGTMTFTIGSASRITVTYSQDNGIGGTIVLVRAAVASHRWSFRGYANDVRVAKPLVGAFQLGVSHSSGSGSGSSGSVTDTFTPKDQHRYGGPYSFSATVTGSSYHANAHATTKTLVLALAITQTNGPRCGAGDTGSLTLTDSSTKLSNGQRADKAEFAWDNSRCPGFVQGWSNEDGGAKTSPSKGGPPNGGQWAVVTIG